jgi:hypothetical protein
MQQAYTQRQIYIAKSNSGSAIENANKILLKTSTSGAKNVLEKMELKGIGTQTALSGWPFGKRSSMLCTVGSGI